MLPARNPDAPSLADVLASCLGSVRGEATTLSLPQADHAIVVLVDGLGVDALRARAGHARTLSGGLGKSSTMDSGFPSTTATAITTLTTGVLAGRHGMVGYSALDGERDRVVNQLTGWDDWLVPESWQPEQTLFSRAEELGLSAVAIGPERYRDTGFSRAALRGARYLGGATIADRVARATDWLRSSGPGIAYLYIPELDVAAHAHGWESSQWTTALENADAALTDLIAALGPRDGMLVTADHGIIDIAHHSHVLIDDDPGLLDGIRHVAGEPRCLQLHLEPAAELDTVLARWQESESHRSWIATRDEVIEAGWFGEVAPYALPRMGDLFIAARKGIAYYDSRTGGSARKMVGQHGSLSPQELRVPLLRFGRFER